VPALAEAVEGIVGSIMKTGEPVIGIEVAGQRADQTDERFWMTYWHPLRSPGGEIVGVNVAAEEITERKRAEAALRASEQETRSAKDAAETALRNLRETRVDRHVSTVPTRDSCTAANCKATRDPPQQVQPA
jgi:hypothetical protein